MKGDLVTVTDRQRFTERNPCPICGGHKDEERGKGRRCWGYLSDDGEWAHCTREEYAGELERHPSSGTYAHYLAGACNCGVDHEGCSSDDWDDEETDDRADNAADTRTGSPTDEQAQEAP